VAPGTEWLESSKVLASAIRARNGSSQLARNGRSVALDYLLMNRFAAGRLTARPKRCVSGPFLSLSCSAATGPCARRGKQQVGDPNVPTAPRARPRRQSESLRSRRHAEGKESGAEEEGHGARSTRSLAVVAHAFAFFAPPQSDPGLTRRG
jgi:hypothetical protein